MFWCGGVACIEWGDVACSEVLRVLFVACSEWGDDVQKGQTQGTDT